MPPVRAAQYEGSTEFQTQAADFLARIQSDPHAMAAGLDLIAHAPVTVDQLATFLAEKGNREARSSAFLAAAAFVALPASGDFAFDRSTERLHANDDFLKQLLTRHRATADVNPTSHELVTRQIRARRLALYAASLATSANGQRPAA